MPQDVFFIDYSKCNFDEWKYMRIQKKGSYKLTQTEKEHSLTSLVGSYSPAWSWALNSKTCAHLGFAYLTCSIVYLNKVIAAWKTHGLHAYQIIPDFFFIFLRVREMSYKIRLCRSLSNNTCSYRNTSSMMASDKQQKMWTCASIDCSCWK